MMGTGLILLHYDEDSDICFYQLKGGHSLHWLEFQEGHLLYSNKFTPKE